MKKKILAASLGLGLVCSAVIGSSAMAGPSGVQESNTGVVEVDEVDFEPNYQQAAFKALMRAFGGFSSNLVKADDYSQAKVVFDQ